MAFVFLLFHGGGAALRDGKGGSGNQPTFGIFRSRTKEATGSIQDMMEFSSNLIASLRNRPPPPIVMRKAIFLKTKEEQANGLVSRFMDREEIDEVFGVGRWASIMRFAVRQNDKYRMIDNGRHGANWTYAAEETIHTTSAAAAAACVRRLRRLADRKLRGKFELKAGSRDMKRLTSKLQWTPTSLPLSL